VLPPSGGGRSQASRPFPTRGESLYMCKLLGHAQPKTTQRYAHDDPVRAVSRLSGRTAAAMAQGATGEVVPGKGEGTKEALPRRHRAILTKSADRSVAERRDSLDWYRWY